MKERKAQKIPGAERGTRKNVASKGFSHATGDMSAQGCDPQN